MAYISRYTGKQVDEILAWAVKNKGIQIDTLLKKGDGEVSDISRSTAVKYNLIFVHGYVVGSHIPNQGMLVFNPRLIEDMQSTGPDKNGQYTDHGVFSTTVFRGTPNGPDGAPIAIEVYLRNPLTIGWRPCYDIKYGDDGQSFQSFFAQEIIGIRAIDPYE